MYKCARTKAGIIPDPYRAWYSQYSTVLEPLKQAQNGTVFGLLKRLKPASFSRINPSPLYSQLASLQPLIFIHRSTTKNGSRRFRGHKGLVFEP
ncbi:hypothetical protein V6Z12_A07G061100 [Gossypium hirsutum]